MRLLFIGPSLGAGGAERQWSILLPGLRRRGHDARLIALDAGGPMRRPLERAGVPVDVIGMRHQLDLRPLVRSPLVRQFVPDVVVTRGVSGLWVGQAAAALRRARHVFNDHRGAGFAISPRRERMTRLVARRLDLVVAVTDDQIAGWIDRGVPGERIVVIPNGVETPSAAEPREQIRASLGITPPTIIAVLVASMRAEKRIADFVTAVRIARESHPELVGLVVGEGPERGAVEAAAGGDPGVRLLGHRDDVLRILQAADMFVLTSEYEAAPMAILEAMAAGLPVIATAVGGIPAIVADGVSGVLVEPGSPASLIAALERLAHDPELRARMGSAGAERHRRDWDAERMIDEYARVLDRIVSEHG